MKHHFWMLIGCVLPLVLIFLWPLFGVGSGSLLVIYFIICFGMHLVMMVDFGQKHDGKDAIHRGCSHGDH
jgi:RsiW-degrading membrane proteinase PrsW (M82 family)